jgi:membrane-associated HD superfamily phosphohydrolase
MTPIQILRHVREKVPYQTAWSAILGDPLLVVALLIVITIIKRGVDLPQVMENRYYHLLALAVGIGIGVAWFLRDRPKQWGDRYHHLVVAPMVAYMLFAVFPVIFISGTTSEINTVLCLVVIYLGTAAFDWKTGLIYQRQAAEERLRFKWPE